MSWWNTGNGDDLIGDQPADLARHVLQRMAGTSNRRSQDKPTLTELLRAIGIVATSDAGKELADQPAGLHQIIAELKSGESIASGPLREEDGVANLVRLLAENLRASRDVYQERWERKPRFDEWLKTFEFVLRYRPEDFLKDGTDHPLARIKIE